LLVVDAGSALGKLATTGRDAFLDDCFAAAMFCLESLLICSSTVEVLSVGGGAATLL